MSITLNESACSLPRSWTISPIKDVVDILDGERIPVNAEERARRPGTVPYYGATGQVGWIDDFLFDEDLVLLGEDGAPFLNPSKPKAYIITGKSWVNNHAHVLRARRQILSKEWLCYWLNTFDYRDHVNGTTRLKLTQAAMRTIPVPIAPHDEQDRIVAEIDKQFTRLDAGVTALKRAQANLRRYKTAIQKYACEGRLIGPNKIHQTVVEVNENSLGGRQNQVNGSLPDLPKGWRWVTLEQLAAPDKYAITDGPFGSNLKTEHYTNAGPRVIRLQNIGDGVFVDEYAHISFDRFTALAKHQVHAGDLVIAALGEILPRACVIPDHIGDAIVKADCIRFKPNPRVALAAYLNIALNAQPTRQRTTAIIHGMGRPRLNLREIKAIQIPLPPLDEQHQIVAELERCFSLITRLEAIIEANLERAERLRQAILEKAFSGKLVPQDPSDEPAAMLLERIRAERQQQMSAHRFRLKTAKGVTV